MEKPLILAAFLLVLTLALSCSINGYGFEAWGKTYTEAFLLSTISVAILIRKSIHKTKPRLTQSDFLLLIPPTIFGIIAVTGHYGNLNGAIQSIAVTAGFVSLIVALNQVSRTRVKQFLYVLVVSTSVIAIISLFDFAASAVYIDLETELGTFKYPLFLWQVYGGFAQRNVFASFLATICLIGLTFIWESANRSEKIKNVLLVCVCICAFVLGTLASLTGLLGLFVGLTVIWIYNVIAHRPGSLTASIFPILIVISSLIGVYTARDLGVGVFKSEPNYSLATEKISFTSHSSKCRFLFLQTTAEMFRENPLTGAGLNTFSLAHEVRNKQRAESGDNDCLLPASNPHNVIGLLLGETGAAGTIAILAPYMLFLFRRNRSQVIRLIALSSPVALHCLTEMPYTMSMYHWALIGLISRLYWPCQLRFKFTKNRARFEYSMYRMIGIVSIACFIWASNLMYVSHYAGIELAVEAKNDGRKSLIRLQQSEFRNHPLVQHRYDRLIAGNTLLLAIATNDEKLAETFKPILIRGLSALANPYYINLLGKLDETFPALDTGKWGASNTPQILKGAKKQD